MLCYGPTPNMGVQSHKTRALCADGKVRTVTYTAYPDTFFSQPARTTVKVKRANNPLNDTAFSRRLRTVTVSGFVSVCGLGDKQVLVFTPTGKNKNLMPTVIPTSALDWDDYEVPSEVIYAD